jgi:hypothetical protein
VKPLRAFLVAGLLAGVFAPRSMPQPMHASCCCPEGMLGACSRTGATCSIKSCAPDDGSALSLIAPKILLRRVPPLPAPLAAGIARFAPAARLESSSTDPSDPPPRA